MPISIGQKVHEGSKFEATLRLINNSFKACTLLVDDSIQRFTLKINEPQSSLDDLHLKAVHLGNMWLERNQDIYRQLTIPYNIMRWDDWRTHKEFQKTYQQVNELYIADDDYKKAIHANIEDFVTRYVTRLDEHNFDEQLAFDCCLQYLKEECSVMCLWALGEYDFEVYPHGRNKAMTATYDKLIKTTYPDLLKSVALRFKKYIKANRSEN